MVSVTGRYDEWAAARWPALLRFAHALVDPSGGGAPDAGAAARRALDRLESRWVQVASRDDPDLVARSYVVAAVGGGQATRRRAAAVLRVLEDRSDAEIAEVLRCSASAARAHVSRGLVGVPPGTALLPETVPTAVQVLPRPAAPRSVTGDRTRRRGGALAGVLAVLALVGGIAWTDHLTSTPAGVITYPHVDVPTDWRVESYAGVELRVPATWGYGASPVRTDGSGGGRRLAGCGSNQAAVVSSVGDAAYATSVTPFVGRPAITDQQCVPWGSDGVMPQTDAVWFGSPLPVGVRTVGTVVAETRAVGDQHVTVFGRSSSLRRKILGTASAAAVDGNGCPARAVQQPQPGPAGLRPTSLSVCVYSEDSGAPELMWSGHLTEPAARGYVDAVSAAGAASPCVGLPHGRWVALGIHGDAGTRWDVVDLGCGAIRGPEGTTALADTTVRTWARDGVTAYAPVPAGAPAAVAPYFHAGG